MAFNALAGPTITLLIYSPLVKRLAKRVHPWLERKVQSRSLDKETASVVMILDIALVAGFHMPVILPLSAVAVYLHACVFRWSVERFEVGLDRDADRPPLCYLWVSLSMGYALLLWLFVASDLHGKWLVVFGVPAASVASGIIYCYLRSTVAVQDGVSANAEARQERIECELGERVGTLTLVENAGSDTALAEDAREDTCTSDLPTMGDAVVIRAIVEC